MTPHQRRTLYAICVIVGITFMVSAGLTFLISPMAQDLGFTDFEESIALSLPGVGSLLIIFVAGRLGDKLGHRPVIAFAGVAFVIGSIAIAMAQGVHLVNIGLFVCGAMATMIQVVALGLLQVTAPDGKAHASAFTTYGMVFPIAYLVIPVATGQLLIVAQWRLVPAIWAISGVVLIVATIALLPRPPARLPIGELWTPILAGLSLAALMRWIGWSGEDAALTVRALVALVLAIVSAGVCIIIARRLRNSSMSLQALREPITRVLMVGVAAVALVGTLTFLTLAIEAMYGLTAFQAALALVPAQASAIVGAKVVALWAIRRWGIDRASRVLVLALALSTLPLLGIRADSSIWYVIVCSMLLNGLALAAVTSLNADIMGRAKASEASSVSGFRGAASTIGATLAVFILGTGVVQAIGQQDGDGEVTAEYLSAIAAALRVDGLLCFIIMIITLGLMIVVSRKATRVEVGA